MSQPSPPPVRALLLDIGGVLLTNGWDRGMRKKAAEKFHLDEAETDERHHLTFDTYEQGKLSLDTYLDRVVFYEPRPFTREEFKQFMFDQSKPIPEAIEFFKRVARLNDLKVGTVSNEGRELTVYRIQTFGLTEFVQFFISSCFVHFRKPDEDMYRIALDVGQVTAEDALYIDDRKMFVEVACGLGIRCLHYTGLENTKKALMAMGLKVD